LCRGRGGVASALLLRGLQWSVKHDQPSLYQ
jgi:hypothetical protein